MLLINSFNQRKWILVNKRVVLFRIKNFKQGSCRVSMQTVALHNIHNSLTTH